MINKTKTENTKEKEGASGWRKNNNNSNPSKNGPKSHQSPITGHQSINIELSSTARFLKPHITTLVRIVLLILIISVFCLQAVCMASHYWLRLHDIHHQGLWKVCTQTINGMECFSHKYQPNYYKPIQIMMIIAIVLHVFSFAYLVLMQIKNVPGFILSIILGVSVILKISGIAIYTEKNMTTIKCSNMTFGWAYFTSWLSVFLTLIAAVIATVGDRYK